MAKGVFFDLVGAFFCTRFFVDLLGVLTEMLLVEGRGWYCFVEIESRLLLFLGDEKVVWASRSVSLVILLIGEMPSCSEPAYYCQY